MVKQVSGLSRLLGSSTVLLVGLGIAIGSGILRTPPLVASELGHPIWVLMAWAFGGFVILVSSLIMSELATRFPESGGEYAWLREAYGPEIAFFFGWGYTIFLAGGGVATIAAAFGDAAYELYGGLSHYAWAGIAVVTVTCVNMLGLSLGAAMQNLLTLGKIGVLLVLALGAIQAGGETSNQVFTFPSMGEWPSATSWVLALPPVIWAYSGSTDSVKLAGEVREPAKSMPKALIGSTVALVVIYLFVNFGLLYGMGLAGLSESKLPAADIAGQLYGDFGGRAVAVALAVVFLGALSSTVLATARVAWALGKDGLGFRALGFMSERQAPVVALSLVGGIAFVFALIRDFEQILGIYFLASALLFGLVYASLIVFRLRERSGLSASDGVTRIYRCPMAFVSVGFMLAVQLSMAVVIAVNAPMDAVGTLGLLAIVPLAYRARWWR